MSENVLDRIVSAVRGRLDAEPPESDLSARATRSAERRFERDRRSFEMVLRAPKPSVIAECKHASPSAGLLREPFDPVALARAYEDAGAAAISVVTEPDYFLGDPAWIAEVRAAVNLPVLRKDFIVSKRQLEETAVLGADAVLLIQRILDPATLTELVVSARELHLEILLEVFTDEDPAPAVASGVTVLGVNARNLATFETRLDRVEAMAEEIPGDRVKVAESGIHSRDDLERLHRAGFHAFLIGEHLVRAENSGAALHQLIG